MAKTVNTIEFIEDGSFMGLLATKGQIPGAVGAPIANELRFTQQLFEVVDGKKTKASSAFKIVRPRSWGKFSATENVEGAFAH